MYDGSAGHAAGDFLTYKKVRIAAEAFGCANRVVVGQGNDRHAQLLRAGVDLIGLVVGLPANQVEQRGVTHARSCRVDMQVASHALILACGYEQTVKRSKNLHECAPGTY